MPGGEELAKLLDGKRTLNNDAWLNEYKTNHLLELIESQKECIRLLINKCKMLEVKSRYFCKPRDLLIEGDCNVHEVQEISLGGEQELGVIKIKPLTQINTTGHEYLSIPHLMLENMVDKGILRCIR